jgi:hypothetical protein
MMSRKACEAQGLTHKRVPLTVSFYFQQNKRRRERGITSASGEADGGGEREGFVSRFLCVFICNWIKKGESRGQTMSR